MDTMTLNNYYGMFLPAGFFGPDGKVKKQKKAALLMNNMEFMNCFMNLYNLAIDTFKWDGLPDTCNARFLEMMLLLGPACIRYDENKGFQTLGFAPKDFNENGEPITGMAYGFKGEFKNCNMYVAGSLNEGVNTVMCRDNMAGYPLIRYIETAAMRLADTKRAMDVAVNTLKQPYFIRCEETQIETVKLILNKASDNEIAVIASSALNPNSVEVLQTGANPAILETYWQHYDNLENQIKNFLGISNGTNLDKKERLLVDEVNDSQEQKDDNLSIRLNQRKLFCEQVNECFGLNISVDVNATRDVDMNGKEENKEDKKDE